MRMSSEKQAIIYDAVWPDDDAERRLTGVFAVGVVEAPAIQEAFVAYSQPDKRRLVQADPSERRLTGPLMIPDQLVISGYTDDGAPIYVRYSAEIIKRVAEEASIRGIGRAVNHEHSKEPGGLYLVESWIIRNSEQDKAASLGMTYPVGTWMVTVAVQNEAYWEEYVATQSVKGFSIEGLFDLKPAVQAAPKPKKKRSLAAMIRKAVQATVAAIMQADSNPATQIQNEIMEVFINMGEERVPIMLDEEGTLPVYDSSGNEIGVIQFVPLDDSAEELTAAEPDKGEDKEKAVQDAIQAAVKQSVEAATKPLMAEIATLKKAMQSSKVALPEAPDKEKGGKPDPKASLLEAMAALRETRK